MTHLNGPVMPLLLRLSQVRIRPFKSNQMNKVVLGQRPRFHSCVHFFSACEFLSPLTSPTTSLTLKLPEFSYPHLNWSALPLFSILLFRSSWWMTLPISVGKWAVNHSSDFQTLNPEFRLSSAQKSLTLLIPSISSWFVHCSWNSSNWNFVNCCHESLKKYASSPLPISQKLWFWIMLLFVLAACHIGEPVHYPS